MKNLIITGVLFCVLQTDILADSCEKNEFRKLNTNIDNVVSRMPANESQKLAVDINTLTVSHFKTPIIECCSKSDLGCKIHYNHSKGPHSYSLYQFVTQGTNDQNINALECIKEIDVDQLDTEIQIHYFEFVGDLNRRVMNTFK